MAALPVDLPVGSFVIQGPDGLTIAQIVKHSGGFAWGEIHGPDGDSLAEIPPGRFLLWLRDRPDRRAWFHPVPWAGRRKAVGDR